MKYARIKVKAFCFFYNVKSSTFFNVFSQNLRSDFELKFLVEAAKPHDEEISSASKAKLETAVAELQNRIQKKADVDDMENMLQINQNLKDVRNHIFKSFQAIRVS